MVKNHKKLIAAIVMSASIFTTSFTAVFATPYNDTTINADLNSTVKPDHIMLTYSDDPTTTQTITWRTNTTVKTGIVQYIKLGGNSMSTQQTDVVTPKEFDSAASDKNVGKMNMFTVTIKGLDAGSKYMYRVGDGTNWSKFSTFKTEETQVDDFKFLLFGDSQSGNAIVPEYTPWHDTIQNAYKANKDARFFVNMGDLVEIGQNYSHWNDWFNSADGVINNIPDMVVQGNHETYDNSYNSTKPQYLTNQFNVYQNGPDGLKGQTYSYNYGNAHFVVLDSQEDEETTIAKGADILEPQKKWLDTDLSTAAQNPNIKFTFVFFHKTPYYNKANRANTAVKNAFTPIFDKYHVDVVFNGHDHGVSRTFPIKGDEFYSRPSDGTVYYVTGRSGNKYYNDLSSKVWDSFFYDPQDQPCYESVEVKGGAATIKSFKQDGTLIDTYVIDKDNPDNSTITTAPGKYNKPRLVIYGNQITYTSPIIKDGKAYVDINLISSMINSGKYDTSTKTLAFSDDNGFNYSFKLTDNSFLADNPSYVSIDSLNSIAGFSNKYDTSANIVYIAR